MARRPSNRVRYWQSSCQQCYQPIEQPLTGRPRRFCSARCRQAARRKPRGAYPSREDYARERAWRRTYPGLPERIYYRIRRGWPVDICLQCGVPYICDQPGASRWHCSPECRRKYNTHYRPPRTHHPEWYRVEFRLKRSMPLPWRCAECGVPFVRSCPGRRYCTHACRQHAYRRTHGKCRRCGRMFKRRAPNQLYCSRRCRSAASRARRRVPPLEKTCLHCGQPYLPGRGYASRQKYCSAACCKAAWRRRKTSRPAGG